MADIEFKDDNNLDTTSTLNEVVEPENNLKEILVNYVGEQHNPESNDVTVHMIVETLAKEFPEFVLAVAEENFIRGYQQALYDVDNGAPSGFLSQFGRVQTDTQSEEQE